MTTKVNTIVVGQGLAGSLLAWNLIQRGEKVLVVDNRHSDSASIVAAGIINPVTGPRLVPSWRLEQLINAARFTYQKLGNELGRQFYSEIELVRLFKDEEERRLWISKKSHPSTNRYLGTLRLPGWKPELVSDPFGSFSPSGSSHLAVAKLLTSMQRFFLKQGSLLHSHLDYNTLQLNADSIKWSEWETEKVIFCEGHNSIQNPFFQNLPFKSSKGEILEVETEKVNLPQSIINRGQWILPIGENRYHAGSTFSWNPLNSNPTEKGKAHILNNLGDFIQAKLHLREHRAGIRPAMKDFRPVIGFHPQCSRIGIFNGLGSKGVLNAPFFADHFASHLLEKTKLDPEVALDRFL
ncbi:MAG: Glycine oxidase [Candidatus Moanabacter tarae]|uniref:Glycine oxidase n=1 Tax=Candidatus Moanibacter tarae TaxID=2200854 RepID=A0A2Z4AE40_9BACT|nr:MAG: Glycine oxidase [Candidatus Moanabacter tarae]|tara:strand:+ start:2654 stop:3709 length:1056 start_codon:yes stop_codon:yes gene_type:complete